MFLGVKCPYMFLGEKWNVYECKEGWGSDHPGRVVGNIRHDKSRRRKYPHELEIAVCTFRTVFTDAPALIAACRSERPSAKAAKTASCAAECL